MNGQAAADDTGGGLAIAHLPIRQYAGQILDAVASNKCIVVIGETGSGKTTQLSQARS